MNLEERKFDNIFILKFSPPLLKEILSVEYVPSENGIDQIRSQFCNILIPFPYSSVSKRGTISVLIEKCLWWSSAKPKIRVLRAIVKRGVLRYLHPLPPNTVTDCIDLDIITPKVESFSVGTELNRNQNG